MKNNDLLAIAPGAGLSSSPTRGKGFVCHFTPVPHFRVRFPNRLNLRFALLLPLKYPYPPSIERALRLTKCRHVLSENRRCAGFALGCSLIERNELSWFIFTLQSDLAFSRCATLRDYLRGWRLILMNAIAQLAREAGVTFP